MNHSILSSVFSRNQPDFFAISKNLRNACMDDHQSINDPLLFHSIPFRRWFLKAKTPRLTDQTICNHITWRGRFFVVVFFLRTFKMDLRSVFIDWEEFCSCWRHGNHELKTRKTCPSKKRALSVFLFFRERRGRGRYSPLGRGLGRLNRIGWENKRANDRISLIVDFKQWRCVERNAGIQHLQHYAYSRCICPLENNKKLQQANATAVRVCCK